MVLKSPGSLLFAITSNPIGKPLSIDLPRYSGEVFVHFSSQGKAGTGTFLLVSN